MTSTIGEELLKSVRDASGHMHGEDGKFETTTSKSGKEASVTTVQSKNGAHMGTITHRQAVEGKAEHLEARDHAGSVIGEHGTQGDAEKNIEEFYVKHAAQVRKDPGIMVNHIRAEFLPGVHNDDSKYEIKTTRKVSTGKLMEMVHLAFELGHHYGNPVRASRDDVKALAGNAGKDIKRIAEKHFGELDSRNPDADNVVSAKSARMAIEDAMKLGEKQHERVLGKVSTMTTIGDVLKIKKMDIPAANITSWGSYKGSIEDALQRMKGPLCAGSGCDNPPEYNEKEGGQHYAEVPMSSGKDSPHYLSVIATFPDHAYVKCDQEDKIWKVPYVAVDGEISTGEPEEATITLATVAERDGDADDADELGADDV